MAKILMLDTEMPFKTGSLMGMIFSARHAQHELILVHTIEAARAAHEQRGFDYVFGNLGSARSSHDGPKFLAEVRASGSPAKLAILTHDNSAANRRCVTEHFPVDPPPVLTKDLTDMIGAAMRAVDAVGGNLGPRRPLSTGLHQNSPLPPS